MIKKVDGIKRPIKSTSGITETQSITATEVKGIDKVQRAQTQQGVMPVRRPTRPITAAERQELLRLINEEAEKMFASKEIPEKKKETIKSAVKMVIKASDIDED